MKKFDENTQLDMNEFKKYVKKPIPIHAKQMDEDFEVKTLEASSQKGNAGDYLVIGIKGELYPCRKDIFEESYEEIA